MIFSILETGTRRKSKSFVMGFGDGEGGAEGEVGQNWGGVDME